MILLPHTLRKQIAASRIAYLADKEPRILVLLRDAQLARPSRRDFRPTYELYKRRLASLVGWEAEKIALRSSEDYDLVHRLMLDSLEGKL